MEITDETRQYIKDMFAHWNDATQQEPPLVLTFGKFAKGDYPDGEHNLYIVWRGKQALYVGISRDNIYNRWFERAGQSHMYFAQVRPGTFDGGRWVGLSCIGNVIARNQPAALRWKIELRHVINDLHKEESRLIQELKPLYNVMGCNYIKTPKESRLYNMLLYGEAAHIANEGTARIKGA